MFSLQKFRPMCSLSNVKPTSVRSSRFVSTTFVQMPRTSIFLVRNNSKNTSSHVPNPTYYIPLRNMSDIKPKLSIKERLQDAIDFILSDPIVNTLSCFVLVAYLLMTAQDETLQKELGWDINAKKPSKDS